MRLNDPAVVRDEYATEERFAARSAVYAKADGADARDRLLELLHATPPLRVLEVAAFCMAVYFQGLSTDETFTLTEALIAGGETLDLHRALGRTVVDKHSTGGVGDKTSLAVGPIVAACGVPFGKMSGRGLGHTGGTLDKLESIPGFRVELTTDEFIAQVRDVGIAIIGQTARLVPGDKLLYALRDVTATVDSIPLIASSIMSKKIAAGADAIVLDVKVGEGAFMTTLAAARALATGMRELGQRAGRRVVCVLTDMDQPLGHAVGNALEIRETLATLRGEGPPDFTELVVAAATHLLTLSDLDVDDAGARERVEAVVQDGSALATYERWIRAQGGDPAEGSLALAPVVQAVSTPTSGYVAALSAITVGRAALHLGAGRRTKDEAIDHSVGIRCLKKRGDAVTAGETLAEVHARDEGAAHRAVVEIVSAYVIAERAPEARPVLLETIT